MYNSPRPQAYAPTTSYSVTPSHLNATIPLNEEVKLHTTASERETYESLAELYSIIVTLDAIEKAYLKDSITEQLYAETCSRLLKQYKSNLADEGVSRAFGDLERFKREWDIECPRATERLRIGLPATIEQGSHTNPNISSRPNSQHPGSSSATTGAAATALVAASENFITLLDAIRIGMTSKDQLHPLLVETIQSVNKVTNAEFEGKEKIVQWLITLNQMRASESLDEDRIRDLQFDMEGAYFGFKQTLN